MKTSKTIIEFKCDRCKCAEERNVNQHSGDLISFEVTYNLEYQSSYSGKKDLCQKCSNDFVDFMKTDTHLSLYDLSYYYNTTVGMFATDRPDLVDDSMHRVLIELEEIPNETKPANSRSRKASMEGL